jgi:hypothetical protein
VAPHLPGVLFHIVLPSPTKLCILDVSWSGGCSSPAANHAGPIRPAYETRRPPSSNQACLTRETRSAVSESRWVSPSHYRMPSDLQRRGLRVRLAFMTPQYSSPFLSGNLYCFLPNPVTDPMTKGMYSVGADTAEQYPLAPNAYASEHISPPQLCMSRELRMQPIPPAN